jgi:glycosyltransferase involved in cell wall biosynthesis
MGSKVGDRPGLLFANNYNMRIVREKWSRGLVPGHHLWGTAKLSDEFDVTDIACSSGRERTFPIRSLERLLGESRLTPRFGDLDLQYKIWSKRKAFQVLYSGTVPLTRLLATARRLHMFSVPMVGVCLHAPSLQDKAAWKRLQGYDALISISAHITDQLLNGGVESDRLTTLSWGPDLDYPAFQSPGAPHENGPVVSVGKTGRDVATLIAALRRTGFPAQVYAPPESIVGQSIPRQVEILDEILSYATIMPRLKEAAVVAIPLSGERLTGLTELVDAIACSRPVIVTRSPYFDIDVEKIGCGWWVDEGDVDGWCRLLTDAMSDRDRLSAMGARGRRWAESHCNMDQFGRGVQQVLQEVSRGSA